MKNLKLFSLFLICLMFTSCALDWLINSPKSNGATGWKYNQPKWGGFHVPDKTEQNMPSNTEPDKCYAKCVFFNDYSNKNEQVPEYTETDYNVQGVKRETVIISPATTKWEKGKADPNCTSPDPEDCLVMCLVELPAVTETHYIITDTSLNRKFELKDLTINELIKLGGKSGWVEVLCEIEITSTVVKRVNEQLIDSGYLNGNLIEEIQIFGSQTEVAIRSYQEAHGLPIGGALNIPTLEHLGIIY